MILTCIVSSSRLLRIVLSLPGLPPSVFSLAFLSCSVSLSWDPGLHNLPHTFVTCSSRGSSHHACSPPRPLSFLPVTVKESLSHSHDFPLTCSFLFSQTALTSLLKSLAMKPFSSPPLSLQTPRPMMPCSLSFG